MSRIKILAGDFSRQAGGEFKKDILYLTPDGADAPRPYNGIDIAELHLADERAGIKIFGAVGWGALGAVLAGPVGAAVGGLLGGRGERVTFIAVFNNGRKLMAECEKKTWLALMAQHFGKK